MLGFLDTCRSYMPKVKDYNGELIREKQYKYNGYLIFIVVDASGEMVIAGKREDYTKELAGNFTRLNLPPSSCIIGELFLRDGQASSVITAIKEDPFDLNFCGFFMPFLRGEDKRSLHHSDMRNLVTEYLHHVPNCRPPQTVEWEEGIVLDPEELKTEARLLGIEGFVLKNGLDWYKCKPLRTVDAVVTGWEEGDGRNIGELGALNVSLVGRDGILKYIGRVGTGFDKQMRKRFTRDFVMGKIVEISYQDVLSKGGLQHPRFIRFRDDKDVTGCSIEQIGG